MSYIGREPQIGNFQMCDAISVVNNQASYSMQVGGVAVIPGGNFNVIASVNGVVQKSGTSFTTSSSTIIFSENLVTGDVIDFILILGSVLDLGVPSDGTVTTGKIADNAVTVGKISIPDNAKLDIGTGDDLEIYHDGTNSNIANKTGTLKIATETSSVPITLGHTTSLVTVADNISVTGDVFIGTTSATNSAKITNLFSRVSHIGFVSENNGGNFSTEHIRFKNTGTTRGSIVVDQNNTTYNTTSDYRLKENVNYDWNATTRLKQLKPAQFNFISDSTNTLQDGFLAHEVSSVVPVAVFRDKDEVEDDGSVLPQQLDHSKLVPLLVKTIQELEARITELENA